jgi:pimeloyl-ACP methyl ester carboxylesterase
MPDIRVAGHRLEVFTQAPSVPGRGWVVFLHEGLGSAVQWRGFPARLADMTGCGTLVYSRPGYGGSETRPRPWPADLFADEATVTLPALLRHLDIADPVLFGHSDGGTIAIMHAAARPGVARGVIAEAAHVMLEEVAQTRISRMRQRYLHGDIGARFRKYHGDHADETVLGWTDLWLSDDMRTWDIRPSLGDIRVPILVIQGREDEYGTLAQVEAIVDGAGARSESLVLDECGHVPHRERPDAVLAAAARFIRQIQE